MDFIIGEYHGSIKYQTNQVGVVTSPCLFSSIFCRETYQLFFTVAASECKQNVMQEGRGSCSSGQNK